MLPRFRDRREAGQALAKRLGHYRGRADLVVFALPRGGVPVGWEVAHALSAPLDVFVVRKLGVPWHEELAMGAIATGGVRVLHDAAVRALGIRPEAIEQVAARELVELERREKLYRGDRPRAEVAGRTVLLVDDGLATGATMKAAVQALRRMGPARVVVGVPLGSPEACADLRAYADEVMGAESPDPFRAVGLWYEDFEQTTDDEVIALLARPTVTARARPNGEAGIVRVLSERARPLRGEHRDHDALLDRIGDARVVLLGEATHGTHEFYRERAEITRRLVIECGFTFVAVEADWPDAWRVDRFVRGRGADVDAVDALAGFKRFPAWMWRNADVLDFVGWLRAWNDGLPRARRGVGFYGLDLYSLHGSMDAVLGYLDRTDPEAARRARDAYGCILRFGDEPQRYGRAASMGLAADCEERVLRQLLALQRRRADYLQKDGHAAEDAYFSAEQNARLVANAEEYYRAMFHGRVSSWNLRDTHMADTLDAILEHESRLAGRPARGVVWAHNSHVGDARHTEMGELGELNIGQLARERHPGQVFNVGFTTSTGTVTAASSWGGPAERKRVRPPLPGSYERLFHRVALPRWFLDLRDAEVRDVLQKERLERAIGVLYLPETERHSHYFTSRLPEQFDAVFHFDQTRAVEPLERTGEWTAAELPETYPEGV